MKDILRDVMDWTKKQVSGIIDALKQPFTETPALEVIILTQKH